MPNMTDKLRADLKQLKEDLSDTEKRFLVHSERIPVKTRRGHSPMPEKRVPWNYGGKSSTIQSLAQDASTRLGQGPTHPRSRSPSRLGNRSLKHVVHKETIDAGDKQTIVEVTVKTKHQSSMSSVSGVLNTDEHLAGKLSNLKMSQQESKKYDPSCVNPGPSTGVRKEPSWSNILSQKPHPTIPDLFSNKRSCETSVKPHQKQKPGLCPNHKTKCPEFCGDQKSSKVWLKEVHKNGGNIPSMGPHDKVKFLIKELKGNSLNDPNIQMILLDLEEALNNLPSFENVEPPVASLAAKTPSAQPTVQRQLSGLLSESPKMVSSNHNVDCQGQGSVTEPDLLRLSPDPLSSEQHLLKKKSSDCKGKAAPLIENFLKILNSVPQLTSTPEDEHRSKRSHSKNDQVPVFKEQLENACRVLEATCMRIEDDCEKLKKEKADIVKVLRVKETELQTVLSSMQTMEKEFGEMRAELQRANTDRLKLHEEQAANSRNENNIKDLQKRVEQVSEENKKLAIDMNMSRLEKEKLSMMLSNKMKEAERYKREIEDIQAIVLEQLANIHSVSDHNKTLTQLDAMMRSLSKRSLLSDITLEEKNFEEGDLSNFRFENLNPVHSSPNSSACSSELYTSWQRLSTITSATESTKRAKKSRGTQSQRRKEKITEKTKPRASTVGDIFTELKNKSSASAAVSLPSPPRDIGLSLSGISRWTEESTHGSMTISDDSQSDTASTV